MKSTIQQGFMEQRLTSRLESYWGLLRQDAVLPEYLKVNASAISDVWKYCVVLQVLPGELGKSGNLQVFHVGDALMQMFSGLMGKSFSTSHKIFPAAAVVRRAQECIDAKQVLYDDGQFVNERSKVIKYRSCMAPFSSKDRVSHLVTCITWREF